MIFTDVLLRPVASRLLHETVSTQWQLFCRRKQIVFYQNYFYLSLEWSQFHCIEKVTFTHGEFKIYNVNLMLLCLFWSLFSCLHLRLVLSSCFSGIEFPSDAISCNQLISNRSERTNKSIAKHKSCSPAMVVRCCQMQAKKTQHHSNQRLYG